MACPCQGHPRLNLPALRKVLGVRSLSESLERKAAGQPRVNTAAMWRYFTTSVYQSGDLAVIATREALQNSVDAIRAAVRGKKVADGSGRFDVTWDPDTRVLTWADNGIGMDEATILDKFLSLGDSGKGGADDSDQAAGGFGVAKAVILGLSETFRWEMHTRNNRAVSQGPNQPIEIFEAPFRQGTSIQIFDVPQEYVSRYDYAENRALSLLERLRRLLGANDLPSIALTLNGEALKPLFSRRAGSFLGRDQRWATDVTATVKAYRRPPGSRTGAFYIRLGGLFQYIRPSNARLPSDIVVDLSTTIRPGQPGYPLSAARDQLQGDAHFALYDLAREVERENATVGAESDYTVFMPDSASQDRELLKETEAAFADADFQSALAVAAGGLSDYYQARAKETPVLPSVSSDAPPASRDPEADARFAAVLQAVAEPGARDSGAGELRRVLAAAELPGQPTILTEPVQAAIARAEAGQAEASDGELLSGAATQALDRSSQLGGGGLLQQAAVQRAFAGIQRSSEFVNPAPIGTPPIKISKKHYDAGRARRFRKALGKWMPYLVVWDATLRLLAQEATIRRRFLSGFILDDTLLAQASSDTLPDGSEQRILWIHPDKLKSIVEAHKKRPLALAIALLNTGVHELTHLDGRMGDGHSEQYVVAREDLGIATAHLAAPLAELVAKVLSLHAPKCSSCGGANKRGTTPQQVLVRVESALVAKNPEHAGTLKGWFRANQPLLRLVSSALAEVASPQAKGGT